MKTLKSVLFVIIGAIAIQAQAAKGKYVTPVTFEDLGEYIVFDPNTQKDTDIHFLFSKLWNGWKADLFQDGKWKKFTCKKNGDDYCNFSTSSRKTIKRLFSQYPEILAGIEDKSITPTCYDVGHAAFCRFDMQEKPTFLFAISEGAHTRLLMLRKLAEATTQEAVEKAEAEAQNASQPEQTPAQSVKPEEKNP